MRTRAQTAPARTRATPRASVFRRPAKGMVRPRPMQTSAAAPRPSVRVAARGGLVGAETGAVEEPGGGDPGQAAGEHEVGPGVNDEAEGGLGCAAGAPGVPDDEADRGDAEDDEAVGVEALSAGPAPGG